MRQITKLVHPFPSRMIEANPKGGAYVSHPVVEQRLLDVVGPVDTHVVQIIRGPVKDLTDVVVGVVLRMTATIDGRTVSVEEAGDCESPTFWPTDGARLKDAMSDAYKRCAMRFGVGLHLWADELFYLSDKLVKQDEQGPPVPPPGSPATTDPTPPGPDGGGAKASRPDDVRVAEDEPQSPPEPTTGSNCRQGEDTPVSSPDAARLSPIDLARLADQAFPITKDDVPPRKLTWTKKRYRYTLTAAVTGGRTVHLDELTADEAIKLAGRFRDIIRARVTWEALEDGLRIGARVLPWVDPDTATVAA